MITTTDGVTTTIIITVAETNTTPDQGDITITILNPTTTIATVDTTMGIIMGMIMGTIMATTTTTMDGEERDLWSKKMILPTSTELGER